MDHSQARSIDRVGLRFGGALFPFLIAFGASAVLTVGVSVSVRLVSKLTGDPRTPEQRASEETDRFLAMIAAGDTEESYKRFTRDLRETVSEFAWARATPEWKALGALQSKELKQLKEESRGSRQWVDVTYQGVFAKGNAKVSALYLKAPDGRWLVDSFNFVPETDSKAASKPE